MEKWNLYYLCPRVTSDDQIYIGDSKSTMYYENICMKGIANPATNSLYDFLFLWQPEHYTKEDLWNYGDIVNATDVGRGPHSALQYIGDEVPSHFEACRSWRTGKVSVTLKFSTIKENNMYCNDIKLIICLVRLLMKIFYVTDKLTGTLVFDFRSIYLLKK